jgi:hypothetical protein
LTLEEQVQQLQRVVQQQQVLLDKLLNKDASDKK